MKSTINNPMKYFMNHKRALTVAIGSLTLLTTQAFSAEVDNSAYREGYALVLEQKWTDARKYFEQFQTDYPDSAWADDAGFWRCYAIEQVNTQEGEHFTCYQNFLQTWPQSSWVSDARSKLLILGTRLASRGNPEYLERARQWRNGFGDFDFDFDGDAIADQVAEAMDRAQQELARARGARSAARLPELPDLPDIENLVNVEELQRTMREVQTRMNRVQSTTRTARSRTRNSADDELLTVLAALRDNEKASEILINRFDESDDPELRSRIVLLLEDFRGEQISSKLVDIIKSDDTEEVRNNAVIVLLDRNEPGSRELLYEISTDSSYSASIRAEILEKVDRWDEARTIEVLSEVLRSETNPRLIAVAADSLSDIGSEAALAALIEAYESIDVVDNRHRVLSEIADVKTPQVLSFLSTISLSDADDETASIAIEGIADRENNIAVAALEHVYLNTTNLQRRLAVIHGIGKADIPQSVEVLGNLLQDETDVQIIAAAMRALGDTEQASAVAVILSSYANTTDESVQRAAIRALGRLDDFPEATEGLLKILEDRLSAESAGQ